jgi:hypothetical protein
MVRKHSCIREAPTRQQGREPDSAAAADRWRTPVSNCRPAHNPAHIQWQTKFQTLGQRVEIGAPRVGGSVLRRRLSAHQIVIIGPECII